MAQGLDVGRLVNVQVNLSPLAAARRGFGTLLILGDSEVIDVVERVRTYSNIEGVANDFGVEAPEYNCAKIYFSQVPQPKSLMVGAYAKTATPAILLGGTVTANLANFKTAQDFSFKINVSGDEKEFTGLDFSACNNLNAIADVINEKTKASFSCSFNGQAFILKSAERGANKTLDYFTAANSGTFLGDLVKLTEQTILSKVDGADNETPEAAAQDAADKSAAWYGLTFATKEALDVSKVLDVAGYIESATPARIFGVTETDTRCLSATYKEDLASKLKAQNLRRTFVCFSQNKHSAASIFGRAFTTDFSMNRSTITLMYKQEPGIAAENLTETQAVALKGKNCNVFVNYNNNSAIIQHGTMANGAFIDEVHGLDWLTDAVQNAIYNLLYTSKAKVPQTDFGQNQLISAAEGVCQEAVNNGLVSAGTWNAEGFGQLQNGDYLSSGYYIYSEPVTGQNQADREARKAPPLQIAVKLAGAIHTVNATIQVNR